MFVLRHDEDINNDVAILLLITMLLTQCSIDASFIVPYIILILSHVLPHVLSQLSIPLIFKFVLPTTHPTTIHFPNNDPTTANSDMHAMFYNYGRQRSLRPCLDHDVGTVVTNHQSILIILSSTTFMLSFWLLY